MALHTPQRNWLRLTADKYPQPYDAYSALRPPQRPLWLENAGAASDHSDILISSDSVTSSGSGMTTAPRRLAECGMASIHFSEQDEWIYVHHILAEAVPSPIIDREGFIWEGSIIPARMTNDLSPSPSLMFANMGGGCDNHLDVEQASSISSSYLCLICVRSAPELLPSSTGGTVPVFQRTISWPLMSGPQDS